MCGVDFFSSFPPLLAQKKRCKPYNSKQILMSIYIGAGADGPGVRDGAARQGRGR